MGKEEIMNNVEVKSILCEIRRKIKEGGYVNSTLSFKDNFEEVFLSLVPKNNDVIDIEEQLDILRNSWEIQPNKPLIGNKLIVFIKRIIRKLTRFFMQPIVKEQNAFNYSVFRVLVKNQEMKIEIENLYDRIIRLEKQIKNNNSDIERN
jgi:hypothetical protein